MQKMRVPPALVATDFKVSETPVGTFDGTSTHWVTLVVVVAIGQGLAPPTRVAHKSPVWS